MVSSVTLLRPGTRANKAVRQQLDLLARRSRWMSGRLRGVSYRLRGRRPDPDVPDQVLADRIRSSLGPLEKRLDLPHLHVMVQDHVALLHGEVGSAQEAKTVERAVARTSGVVGVESFLHVGLTPGDTRPSAGRAATPPSHALQQLLDAAEGQGVEREAARRVVRLVLATLADRLPPGERDHVSAHLPADVRELFTPTRHMPERLQPHTVPEFVAEIAGRAGADFPHERTVNVTRTIVNTLRSLVPEEVVDVERVLPSGLRDLWVGATRG